MSTNHKPAHADVPFSGTRDIEGDVVLQSGPRSSSPPGTWLVCATMAAEQTRLSSQGKVHSALVAGPDGAPVAVRDFAGEGPDLLMAHATGLHGAVWGPVAGHLNGWHCWGLDLRGHGDSPVPMGDDLHWSGFGRDVQSVVEFIGGPVLGIGHSLGGMAMLMAAMDAPELFSALVLYEPALRMETGALNPALSELQSLMVNVAAGRRSRFTTRAEALSNYAVKRPFCDIQAAALHAYVQHGFRDTPDGAVELKCRPAVEAQILRGPMSTTRFGNCIVCDARSWWCEANTRIHSRFSLPRRLRRPYHDPRERCVAPTISVPLRTQPCSPRWCAAQLVNSDCQPRHRFPKAATHGDGRAVRCC